MNQQIRDELLLAARAIKESGPKAMIEVPDYEKGFLTGWTRKVAAEVLAEWITENQANIRVVDDEMRKHSRRILDETVSMTIPPIPGVLRKGPDPVPVAEFILGEGE